MMRFVHDQRGGVMTLFATALPILIGCGMLAVDIGSIHLQTRTLQGVADAAALAAARDPGIAHTMVADTFAASGVSKDVTPTILTGQFRPTANHAIADRFVAGTGSPNAVRVTLTTKSPTFFARFFGYHDVPVSRMATAMRADMAAFSIGSRLASLNDGLLNAYLSALTGSQISLSLLDYNALLGTEVDMLRFSRALATRAGLQAASFDEVLAAKVAGPVMLDALVDTIPAGPAKLGLQQLATRVGSRQLSLDQLIEPGMLGAQHTGGDALVRVDALTLATVLAQLASPKRQVSLDVGAAVPGLAATRLTIAIGERTNQSPWIAVSDTGTPIVRTAQTRIYTETTLPGIQLPGIGSLVAVRAPVLVELASAEARLGGIRCNGSGRGATIEARTAPAMAAIADLDTSRLEDFTTSLALRRARLVNTFLLDVDAYAKVDMGADEPWKLLSFDASDIERGTVRTISSSHPVQSIATSLVQHVSIEPRVAGLLTVPTGPITRTVGQTLGAVAPAIDGLLSLVTGAAGVKIGEADVRVTGLRCGQPVLVE